MRDESWESWECELIHEWSNGTRVPPPRPRRRTSWLNNVMVEWLSTPEPLHPRGGVPDLLRDILPSAGFTPGVRFDADSRSWRDLLAHLFSTFFQIERTSGPDCSRLPILSEREPNWSTTEISPLMGEVVEKMILGKREKGDTMVTR